MLALSFSFPARRYHATPWGRHVNEADVAWPPEPWRILRALIATYWRKGTCVDWSKEDAASLIDALAAAPPIYHLPDGAVHAHTRHYMPAPTKTTLVFDAFAHLPDGAAIVVAWPDLELEPQQFALVADLADGIGYLGRAESWVECTALDGRGTLRRRQIACRWTIPGTDRGTWWTCWRRLPRPLTLRVGRASWSRQTPTNVPPPRPPVGVRRPNGMLRGKRDRTFGVTLPGTPHGRGRHRYRGLPETRLEPAAGVTRDRLPAGSSLTSPAPACGSSRSHCPIAPATPWRATCLPAAHNRASKTRSGSAS